MNKTINCDLCLERHCNECIEGSNFKPKIITYYKLEEFSNYIWSPYIPIVIHDFSRFL